MFDFEKLSASKFYAAPHVERVVEFSPPGIDMQNISKVLSLAVEATVTGASAADGYADVSGRTSFRLTYLDREREPKGVDYNADFTVRAEGEFDAADNVSATITVTESDVEAAGSLKLSAVLDVTVCAIRREELNVLVSAEGCYQQTKEVYLPTFIASKTTVSPFDGEQEVGGEVTAVLSMNTSCIVRRSEAVEGGVKAAATVVSTVTYVEGGEIKQRDFAIDMEEELGLDGVEPTDAVHIDACVKNSKIVLQGVTDDNVIRLEGEAQLRVRVFRCAKTSVADGLFALRNEVQITRETANYVCFDGCGYFTEKVGGTALLGDNRAAAIAINALPYARCNTSKAYVGQDGKLNVEGIVNTDIIYTDENGYNSVRTEIPFTLAIDSEKPLSEQIDVRCAVQNISATVRREREINIDITLAICVCGSSPLTFDYISAVELGEEKQQNRSGVSLYIARGGDALLDLCKAFTAMPDDILAQNPTLEFPLSEGTRAIYFRQLAD